VQSFTIKYYFRKDRWPAVVHKHAGYYLVWFSSPEFILKEFGGQLEISPDLKEVKGKQTTATDQKDFHRAIINEIQIWEEKRQK
jgi:hypothetical protein